MGPIAVSGWCLARPRVESRGDPRVIASDLRGRSCLAPTALIALLWVGLATPLGRDFLFENKMRYAVLLAGSIGITVGFLLLKEPLGESGERLFSTLALATSFISGTAYVVWTSFQLGDFALRLAKGEASPAIVSINNVFDALLFAASALAYVSTASARSRLFPS